MQECEFWLFGIQGFGMSVDVNGYMGQEFLVLKLGSDFYYVIFRNFAWFSI